MKSAIHGAVADAGMGSGAIPTLVLALALALGVFSFNTMPNADNPPPECVVLFAMLELSECKHLPLFSD